MKLRLLNDIDTLKSTDNATEIEMSVIDDSEEVVDLSDYTSIGIAVGYQGARYSSETPAISEDNKSFSFVLSNALPSGKYSIEVTLTKEDGTYHIAPNQGVFILTIEKSLSEVGTTVTVMSVQQLLDDMEEVKRLSESSNADVNKALVIVNTANINANEALIKADQAVTDSASAVTKANNADTKASTALTNSQTAINTANSTISLATTADTNATQAKTDSANALTTANNAKTVANQVRADFDQLTAGNTDAEVIIARTNGNGTTFDNIKARLDDSDSKVSGKYVKPTSGISKTDLDSSVQASLEKAETALQSVTKASMGLGSVDNTFDLDKPISTATQEALNNINTKIINLNDNDIIKVFDSEVHGIRINSNQNLEYYNTAENKWVEIKNGVDFTIPDASLIQKGIVQLTNSIGESESLAVTQKCLSDAINNINVTKETLGLDKVDNTSDLDKPISTKQQEAITNINNSVESHKNNNDIHVTVNNKVSWDAKAPTLSPNFTGIPTAPNPSSSTNNNQIATTSFVQSIANNNTAILVYPSFTAGYQNGIYAYFNKFNVVNDSLGETNGYLITPKNTGYYMFYGQFGVWQNKVQTYGRFDINLEDNVTGQTVTNKQWSSDKWFTTSSLLNITHSAFQKLAFLEAGKSYRISCFIVLNGVTGALSLDPASIYCILARI